MLGNAMLLGQRRESGLDQVFFARLQDESTLFAKQFRYEGKIGCGNNGLSHGRFSRGE